MYRFLSSRVTACLPIAAGALVLIASAPVSGQTAEVVSQQISTSRNSASLRLELSDGRTVDVSLRGGQAYLNGTRVGDAAPDADLDRSFRELLSAVTDAPSQDMPRLLTDWSPASSPAATRLDRALEDAVRGIASSGIPNAPDAPDVPAPPGAPHLEGVPASDSVDRLVERINELETMVEDLNDEDYSSVAVVRDRQQWGPGPVQHLVRGLGSIFSLLVVYAIVFAIAVGAIFFGGRKYIEGVADTARQMTMRSWLVGLAGTFLVVPAFILGIIALAVSIVGIPALLVWVPLFPLAVVLSLVLGYLAVAHAAGEGLAEKRFYGSDWFKRSNSYYFLLNGLGLMLALFIAAGVVQMAGPIFGWIRGLLIFLGVVMTWTALTIGFGAVLVSRGGTRPLGKAPVADIDAFADEAHE